MSRKSVSVALSMVMALGLFVPHIAWAQRDAAAKIRGDFRSFWDPSYPKWGSSSAPRRAARSQVTYRSYTSEPAAGIIDGAPSIASQTPTASDATSASAAAPTQSAPDTLAAAPSTDVRRFSYDPSSSVTPPVVTPSAAPVTRSYVATPRTRATRSAGRHLDAWQYPKTDPRHWRPF